MDDAIVAANRFGLGAGLATPLPPGDGRDWLRAQLLPAGTPAALAGLPDAASGVVALLEFRNRQKELASDGDDKPDLVALRKARAAAVEASCQREIGARYRAALESPQPLIERLVAFWANHFTVSGVRPEVRALVGAFEREAIRPHLLGRFEDLVLAVVRHPAMGLYLDNATSVGPESRAGQRRHQGVNENLGRELLELHTLGVDGGYGETDVRALARILTGWSIARLHDPSPGHFRFNAAIHEPGAQTVLGRRYGEDGEAQGEAAIRDIARHPSTARHIALKLARHFIADQPPDAAVERLAQAFRSSGGDLKAVTEALIASPEPWQLYQAKIKDPWDLVVSASRATGLTLEPAQVENSLRRLGQPVFMAPQPSGWPDDAASWTGPEALLERIDWCAGLAARAGPATDPVALGGRVLAGAQAADAREAVARAESRPTALALLLSSPSFQRR